MLSDDDLIRYSRQVIIPGIEEDGQKILMSTKIMIIGAGGLGCPVALYCAAAGFGNIQIWDNDVVELSNLNRQIGHMFKDIGKAKSNSLSDSCKKLNPKISMSSKINKFEINSDINNYDIIFDCSDNIETRLQINEVVHKNKKILISGSATQLEGQVAVFKSGLESNLPCYECIFPKSSDSYRSYNCREAGILGSVTNLIASIQVTEGIRESLIKNKEKKEEIFLNKSNSGYLILYDGSLQEINKIKINKNKDCKICN